MCLRSEKKTPIETIDWMIDSRKDSDNQNSILLKVKILIEIYSSQRPADDRPSDQPSNRTSSLLDLPHQSQ